jgi:uncharacterized protein
MTWHDLLFAHWPIEESAIRDLVPRDLEIERFDGAAWLGVVPFRMTIRPRGLPGLLKSRFNEVNVRTYVRHRGRSGVWFFSLDATHRLTVWGARRFFHLPYHLAAMSSTTTGGGILYYSRRKSSSSVRLDWRYRPVKHEAHIPAKGSLEEWLTERYCLFSTNRSGDVFCGEIHHPPWLLQGAEAEIRTNTMAQPLGLTLPETPLLHFAKRQDVVAWGLS